jgi:hypothetical protein
MINVIQVVEDLKIGGLESVIENIAMHLNPEKFRVFVLGPKSLRIICMSTEYEIF